MLDCPHCKENLKIPPRSYRNVETFQQSIQVTTECCGNLITLSGTMAFRARKGPEHLKEDSFGIPVKPLKK